MKKNDFIQIKGLGNNELILKVNSLKKELADLVMDKKMKKLKDLRIIFKKRKELAQVLTVLRQKELLAELESSKKNQESKKEKKEEK